MSSTSSSTTAALLAALADGSVKFINESIQHTNWPWSTTTYYDQANTGKGYGIYQRLFSRNDGLVIGDYGQQ